MKVSGFSKKAVCMALAGVSSIFCFSSVARAEGEPYPGYCNELHSVCADQLLECTISNAETVNTNTAAWICTAGYVACLWAGGWWEYECVEFDPDLIA